MDSGISLQKEPVLFTMVFTFTRSYTLMTLWWHKMPRGIYKTW